MSKFNIAVVIFVLTYIFIIIEKIPTALTALLGALALVFANILTSHEFTHFIEFDVIFLLIGMMIIVHIVSDTGIFEWVAIKVAQVVKGNPFPLLALLCIVTAIFSAFLDNVTTILVIVPVTILLARQLNLSPKPFVLAEVIASNIGGTATLIGDPPNLIIGEEAKLSFNEFLVHMSPISIVNLLSFIILSWFFFGKNMKVSRDLKAKILELDASKSIKDKKLVYKSILVFVFVLAGFVLQKVIFVEPGIVALSGAALLMLLTRKEPEEALKTVEWHTIFFFIGLFVLVGGLEKVGVLKLIAQKTLMITKGDLKLTSMGIIWISGIVSSILDNIPYTATVVPMINDEIIPKLIEYYPMLPVKQISYAMWWALSLGACLGGNGTLIGASANVVAASISKKSGYPISFWYFTKYGIVVTIQTLVISSIYVWLRYL